MPRRSNLLQRCIKLIEEAKGDYLSIEESALLPDKETGQMREVDIVVQGAVNGHLLTVSFEVTAQSRPVGAPWVEQQLRKHSCLPTDKLFLVSQSGFSGPARKKAESNGAVAVDLSGGDIGVRSLLQRTAFLRGVTARVTAFWCEDGQLRAVEPGAVIEIGSSRAPASEQIDYLTELPDMRRVFLERTDEEDDVWLEATPPGVVRHIDASNAATSLPGFRFVIRLEKRDVPVRLSSLSYDGIEYIYGSFGTDKVPIHFVASTDGSVLKVEEDRERRQ